MKQPKTFQAGSVSGEGTWYQMDATGKVLGRIATRVAEILMGKHRPTFTPHVTGEDVVVILNAAKVRVTGNKEQAKTYFRHSGYPGGDKLVPLERMRAQHPERIITAAVSGMLPKNRLRDRRLSHLKVFAHGEHTFGSRKLEDLVL